jgi:hypothetical protein
LNLYFAHYAYWRYAEVTSERDGEEQLVDQASARRGPNSKNGESEAGEMALRAERDRIYETFVRPLEQEHRGEFVAVCADGQTVLGPSHRTVIEQAVERCGHGNSTVFRVGNVLIGKIR